MAEYEEWNEKMNWDGDLDRLHEILETYSQNLSKKPIKLPKNFKLVLVDMNPEVEYEVEYRTRIDVVQMSEILKNYFGIDAEVVSTEDILLYEDEDMEDE